MSIKHQSANESAWSALVHSMDAILHGVEKSAKSAKGLHLAGVWTGAEVFHHMFKMVEAARAGRWEEFGDHSLGTSVALLNSATMGRVGLSAALNDATTAVRRMLGDKHAGISSEEALHTGLHAIQSEIAERFFSALHPNDVADVRVGERDVDQSIPRPTAWERLNPQTLALIRDTIRERKTSSITFEPDIISLEQKTTSNSGGRVAQGGQDIAPSSVFALEVQSFRHFSIDTDSSLPDLSSDLTSNTPAELRATVTICPGKGTAGAIALDALPNQKQHLQTAKTTASKASATVDVHFGRHGVSYLMDMVGSTSNRGSHAQALVTVSSAPGSISITGTLACDRSSAHQLVLRDCAGQSVFLAGNVIHSDAQANSKDRRKVERLTSAFHVSLGVDAEGRFDGRLHATLRSASGKIIARSANTPDIASSDQLAAWNHLTIERLNPPASAKHQSSHHPASPSKSPHHAHSALAPER